jgi:hypothetical protein
MIYPNLYRLISLRYKIELLDPKRSMVLAVATSRVAQKTPEELEAEVAAAAAAAPPAEAAAEE